MPDKHKKHLGLKGEQKAVEYLNSQGMSILQRNFRCPSGEIDIIAEDKGTIVFVEVKTRSNDIFGLPQEAVDYHKQKKLVHIAALYLQKKKLLNQSCRFDVISIIMKNNKTIAMKHFINAFSA